MSSEVHLSIVMPAYNAARYISSAIESCLRQSAVQGWELIVVDDGSTDGTCEQVKKYLSDRRVTLLTQPNQGSAVARNHGIRFGVGEYIAFLDSDDFYRPGTLSSFLHVCKNLAGPYALFYCDYDRVDENGAPLSTVRVRAPMQRPYLYRQLLLPKALPILTSTVLVRKSAIEEVGFFNERFLRCQDLELWAKIIEKFDVEKLNIIASCRRIHDAQVTAERREIIHWREEFNLDYLRRHDFGYFCDTHNPEEQSRIAEQFGDAMFGASEPLRRSAAFLYEISLLLHNRNSVREKLVQATTKSLALIV